MREFMSTILVATLGGSCTAGLDCGTARCEIKVLTDNSGYSTAVQKNLRSRNFRRKYKMIGTHLNENKKVLIVIHTTDDCLLCVLLSLTFLFNFHNATTDSRCALD